jgi:predicted Zn-dependent peptidase
MRDETPADRELAEVRDFLVGVFPLRFETTAGIAAALEPLAVYNLSDEYWHTYRSQIEAVTPDSVRATAAELVRPDEALVVLTGDASRIRDEVEALDLGPIEVVAA